MIEHGLSPKKPIYLLGDSFGGALALSVAARNPTLDLILILANPATSYGMSLVHPLVAIGKALPEEFHVLAPYAISPLLGNYAKLVKDGINDESLLEKEMSGGIANQPLHFPFLLPKYPGRLYYKFGKPIRTKGNEHKRKEDPYRCLIKRQL
nr:acyltransferase-like protein At1g54570, chloroplastic [Tanacetum cinerariifolium]